MSQMLICFEPVLEIRTPYRGKEDHFLFGFVTIPDCSVIMYRSVKMIIK